MKWYSKLVFADKEAKAICPSCKTDYPFGPAFDHHPRECPNCSIEIREWCMDKCLFLVHEEKAPEIMQILIKYLDGLTEMDAMIQLNHLERMGFLA